MKLQEEFQVHDKLNPKLFDDAGKLHPEVRQKMLEIVAEFEKSLDIPIFICDVVLVGSNASYNYTEQSDIDLHVIANFEEVNASKEIVSAAYELEKSAFNKAYDIKIKGLDVEIYIEDVQSNTVSNGIYSICDDIWIKEPKPLKSVTVKDISKELEKWTAKIAQVLSGDDLEDVENTINTLYLIRHNALAVEGEYCKGNQLFKEIRNSGMLDKLKDKLKELKSKELSLEGLSKGQLVNRM